jgi:hypothetical protein
MSELITINFSFSSSIYIHLPSRSDMAWNRYLAPFSYCLWLAVAMAACVLCVCLALTNFSNNSNQSLSLIATVFYIPSCFCQQGQMPNPLYGPFILSFMFFRVVLFFNFRFLLRVFLISLIHFHNSIPFQTSL